LAFLELPPKAQIEEVLRIMPVQVVDEEMAIATAALTDAEQSKILDTLDLAGRSGLEILNIITQAIYDARTTENVAADPLEKHAGALKATLDAMSIDETDWGARLSALQEEHAKVVAEHRGLESTLTIEVQRCMEAEGATRATMAAAITRETQGEIAKLQEDAKEAIRRINEQMQSDVNAAKTEGAKQIQLLDQVMANAVESKKADARRRLDSAAETFAPVKEKLAADIAVVQQKRDQQASAKSTLHLIETAKKDALAKRDLQKRMTITLDKIRELKAVIASRLPLPCTISDGRICREEGAVLVPLKKWNTASQYAFVLKLATLAHGAVGFVVVDKMESLDRENRDAFLEAANHYSEVEGMQFITAYVGEGELKVENYKGA
jgi:phosphotransferase system HPr-like phosphotransfer protein